MQPLEILKTEHGRIRVFSVSRPMADMARALKQQPKRMLAAALLNHPVDDNDFELFALSDLTGVGLSGYLSEGYDVDRSGLHKDRARLEALDGYVLLLFSRVSDAGDVTIEPASDLTLIGTYTEARAQHAADRVQTEAAKPYSGATPEPSRTARSRAGSMLTGVAVLLILLLIWWILL